MKFIRMNSRATAIAVAIGTALAAAPHVSAGEGDLTKQENPHFVKLDKNRDGFLTRDEVRHIRDYARAFSQADGNKDRKLDPTEFVKAELIHDRIIVGKYVDDAVITTKVKAALFREPELKSLDVSVETLGGEVLLSGFVTDEAQRQKAMRAAIAVNGVAAVKDALVVR